MKKFLVTGLLAFTALALKAQSDEWLDPEVNVRGEKRNVSICGRLEND